MKKNFKKNSGFTLIELLVVIAIIGLLSSIVFVTLSNSRAKAKDAAIKIGVDEFVKLFELEYNDKGTYAGLHVSWLNYYANNCNGSFSNSNYVTQAIAICNNIYSNARDGLHAGGIPMGATGEYRLTTEPSSANNNKYAIQVFMNNGNWYCAGSSGRKSEHNYTLGFNNSSPGCIDNP